MISTLWIFLTPDVDHMVALFAYTQLGTMETYTRELTALARSIDYVP